MSTDTENKLKGKKMLSSTELIQKLNEHRDNIGKEKATYQEGVLFGYGLLVKEHKLLIDVLKDLEAEIEKLKEK